jgi:hypothetical protein
LAESHICHSNYSQLILEDKITLNFDYMFCKVHIYWQQGTSKYKLFHDMIIGWWLYDVHNKLTSLHILLMLFFSFWCFNPSIFREKYSSNAKVGRVVSKILLKIESVLFWHMLCRIPSSFEFSCPQVKHVSLIDDFSMQTSCWTIFKTQFCE